MLFNKCAKMKAREYTIASSSKKHPQDLHIAVSLAESKLPNGKSKMGATSAYLKQYFESGKMPVARVYTKASSFIMPEDPTTPYVMCGPGTGVVPFLGFIQERELRNIKSEAILYFGCRERDSDFIYREEMSDAYDKKVISDLKICLSREAGEPRTYVQH